MKTQTDIKHVLSFVTLTGVTKFYAGGTGELANGEQTTDIAKAVKFNTSKEAEKVNKTLDTYFFRHSIKQVAENLYIY